MKTHILTAGFLAAVAVIAGPSLLTASAQGVFLSGGYSQIEPDSSSASLGAVTGRAGIYVLGLGAEVEGSIGVSDDAGVELDNQLSAFGVWKAFTLVNVNLFLRAGVSRIELSPGGSDDGFAYGAGGEFFFTPNDGLRADFTRHDYDSTEVDTISLSYVRKL